LKPEFYSHPRLEADPESTR